MSTVASGMDDLWRLKCELSNISGILSKWIQKQKNEMTEPFKQSNVKSQLNYLLVASSAKCDMTNAIQCFV